MDDFSRVTPKASGGSGIGYIVAAILVVLVLLYALFAGGSVSTSVEPTSLDATQSTAPALDDTAPAQPVVPAGDGN